jgi:hypothetical protein
MVHLSERGQEIKLMDVPVGVVIHIKTGRSNWHLCRVEGSTIDSQGYYVHGVMIVTDSEAWGPITNGPFETSVWHVLQIGNPVVIKIGDDINNSGDIKSITYSQP